MSQAQRLETAFTLAPRWVEKKDDTDDFAELNYASPKTSGEDFLRGSASLNNLTSGTSDYAVQVTRDAYRAFGRTPGIATLNWNRRIEGGNYAQPGQVLSTVELGTSAANPYIIEGDALTFRLDVLCNTDEFENGGAKEIVKRIVKKSSDYFRLSGRCICAWICCSK